MGRRRFIELISVELISVELIKGRRIGVVQRFRYAGNKVAKICVEILLLGGGGGEGEGG